MFHVQTEDSGVTNPHVFTHLFHGGVIINTRKLEYDPASAEDVVKSLMQAQHKVVLKLLRRGEFDDKIDAYLGGNPDLQARSDKPVTGTKTKQSLAVPASISGKQQVPPKPADEAATQRSHPVPPPKPPPIPPPLPKMRPSNRPPRRYPRPGTASRTKIAPAPPPAAPRYDASRPQRSGNVVVSKPPIVVASGRPPVKRTVRERSGDSNSIFDQNLITEKSLDEVILAYLSEDAEE